MTPGWPLGEHADEGVAQARAYVEAMLALQVWAHHPTSRWWLFPMRAPPATDTAEAPLVDVEASAWLSPAPRTEDFGVEIGRPLQWALLRFVDINHVISLTDRRPGRIRPVLAPRPAVGIENGHPS